MKQSIHNEGGTDVLGYWLEGEQIPRWQQARACARGGDVVSAIGLLEQVLRKQPGFAPALVQLAHLLLVVDRYRDAREATLKAAAVPARSPALILETVRLLRRFEEHQRVCELVESFDWRKARSAGLLVEVAGELGPIGLYRQAHELLAQADGISSVDPQARYLHGTLELVAGDMLKAAEYLRSALEASTREMAHVRWLLTLQPDTTRIDQDIAETTAVMRRVRPGSEDEAYLAYALHNLLHASGRFEEAWEALENGCRVKRALLGYNRAHQRDLFDALREMRLPEGPPTPGASPGPRILFIVGMHRSGTSVLERVLGGHSQVTDGGESYVFTAAMREATDHFSRDIVDPTVIARAPHANLTQVGERFRHYARWRSMGREWFTEKLPSNFLNVGFILSAIPDALILHMQRDPMDTCFSNLRTFFSQAAPYSYNQEDLADYFLGYRDLMRHWHGKFPGRILDVAYDNFVNATESEARRVMAFCGLEFEADALDVSKPGGHSATASTASVRKGILKDRGRVWKNYEHHLQPMLERLSSFP